MVILERSPKSNRQLSLILVSSCITFHRHPFKVPSLQANLAKTLAWIPNDLECAAGTGTCDSCKFTSALHVLLWRASCSEGKNLPRTWQKKKAKSLTELCQNIFNDMRDDTCHNTRMIRCVYLSTSCKDMLLRATPDLHHCQVLPGCDWSTSKILFEHVCHKISRAGNTIKKCM